MHKPMVLIDMGTTRTRIWTVLDGRIVSFATGDFGARDTATKGSKQVKEQLLALIARDNPCRPETAIAAGMITSPQGFSEVPHVAAPADLAKIAAGMQEFDLDGIPLWLVPGVRKDDPEFGSSDLMRGEETLCAGLLASGFCEGNTWLLTLGSHWKWIYLDQEKRIARSVSSLAGEMIHAIQVNTLLAASLPQERPSEFDEQWVLRGMADARREGLGRALFSVRLLHLNRGTSELERISFFYGAIMAQELDTAARLLLEARKPILISGNTALAVLWKTMLCGIGMEADVLQESERDHQYLYGLLRLLEIRTEVANN